MKTFLDRRSFIKMTTLGGLSMSTPSLASIFPVSNKETLPPLLVDSKGNPIATLDEWEKQRELIRERWLEYLGALESNPNPPKLQLIKEDRPEDLIRQLVSYESEPGITVQGYLIKPREISKPLPGIVAMHSTSDRQMVYITGVEKDQDLVR